MDSTLRGVLWFIRRNRSWLLLSSSLFFVILVLNLGGMSSRECSCEITSSDKTDCLVDTRSTGSDNEVSISAHGEVMPPERGSPPGIKDFHKLASPTVNKAQDSPQRHINKDIDTVVRRNKTRHTSKQISKSPQKTSIHRTSENLTMHQSGELASNLTSPPKQAVDMSDMDCLHDVGRFLRKAKDLAIFKELILLYVDSGYLDMAINLYLSSLKPFHITNYIFLCSDNRSCTQLAVNGMNYFQMCSGVLQDGVSGYGTIAFRMKMKFRGKVLLGLLRSGYTVLNCDTDIVFLHDPLVYIRNITDADMVGMDDTKSGINAGFMYIRPTPGSLMVYNMMEEIALKEPAMEEQKRLNTAITNINRNGVLVKVFKLPVNLFPSGRAYFIDGGRVFAGDNPDPEVIALHNNWIVSREAKVYRFREHSLWLHEKDGYYSSPERRYLTYENPIVDGGLIEILQMEKMALKTALTLCVLLNRTLILPEFHVDDPDFRRGSLSFLYSMVGFDHSFKDTYREHVFLKHPLVPESIKKSNSIRHIITASLIDTLHIDANVSIKTPKNALLGATETEVLEWFGFKSESVLRFHSLYGAFAGFDYIVRQQKFDELFTAATVACDMLQRCDESLLPPGVRKQKKRRLSMRPPSH